MTKMKKKLALIVSLCLLALGLVGCSGETTDPNAEYNGYTAKDLEANSQYLLNTLTSMTEAEQISFLTSGDEISVSLIMSWMDVQEEVGEFIGFGEFTVTESKDTLATALTCDFANRDIILNYTFDAETMAPASITIERVFTKGEVMEKAALNTAMGLGTVFFMLIVISLIIACFGFIPKIQAAFTKKKEAPADNQVVEQIQQREEQLTDDLELVAVIAAAVAAASGTTTDDFVVRSIRRRR